VQEPLRQWTRENHRATLAPDRKAMAAVAEQFDSYIRDGNPDEFRLDREPSLNLDYGTGIHVRPGAPLARL